MGGRGQRSEIGGVEKGKAEGEKERERNTQNNGERITPNNGSTSTIIVQ